MPKLFVLGGTDVGSSFEVDDGAVLGRHPDCAVPLRDRSVSRQHARIEREGDRWYVVDLGSRNGVRIEDEKVGRAQLTDRVEFVLGELPLRFRLEEPAPAETSPAAVPPSAVPPPAVPPPDPAPPRNAPPTPPRRRRTAPAEEDDDDGGIVLEEEIDLGSLAETRDAPVPSRTAPPSSLSERDQERARILRESAGGGGGFLSGDLAQRPLWVRALVYLFVLLVAVALCAGAFLVVQNLRGSL